MENNKLHKKYIQVHNKMIEKNGFSEKSLWGSKGSQQIRFKVLSELIKTKEHFSILDIGCGLCDFNQYLTDAGFENFSYTGLEINPLFVKEASIKYPNINIIHGSIEALNSNQNWDYVFASGIYNLGDSSKENLELFCTQFNSIYQRINKGFGVNFLSKYSENQDNVSVYHNPLSVLELCLNNFSKYVKLDQTYLPHDFTVLVYKEKNS
jgi:SAM-dependent methyltransferase